MTRLGPILASFLVVSAQFGSAQSMELSAVGGIGFAAGEDHARTLATGGGASLGWFLRGKHGIRLDYFFENARKDASTRHFLTGSYVVQRRSGNTRPFFQMGAGVMREGRKDMLNSPSGVSVDFAAIIGTGLTIDMGRALFVRPELRTYWYVGPTIAVLPSVSVGLRF